MRYIIGNGCFIRLKLAGDPITINHGGTRVACPKCRRRNRVICLAGGIALNQTSLKPMYCMSCKKSFVLSRKKEQAVELLPFLEDKDFSEKQLLKE